MALSRRDFFENVVAAGGLAALLSAGSAPELIAEPLFQTRVPGQPALPEYDAPAYWNNFFTPPPPPSRKNSQSLKPKLTPAQREAQFMYMGPQGLQYVDDIAPSQLPDYDGDVQVSIALGQFRAGTNDQQVLKDSKSAQFRVDCTQTKPYLDILAPLAWCAIASLKPDAAGQLPSLQSLGFDSPNATSGVTKILLPKGTGKMAVNVYYTKGTTAFQKFLKDAFEALEGLAPVMNFPAASIPAMKTFSLVLGKLEERAAFLMNSDLTGVVASKNAYDDPDRPVQYLSLVSGDYVLVPAAHAPDLKPHFSTLQVEQGYLVDKNATKSDPLSTRADQVLPGVTYATLKISVTEAPSSPSGSDANSSGSGGSGGKSKVAESKRR